MPRSPCLRLACLLLFPILLGGCAAAVVGGAAGGYYLGKDENRSIGDAASDAEITARVKASLIKDEAIRALDIDVDTFGGLVYLEGKVKSEQEKDLALRIARETQGVKRVESRLTVEPVVIEDQSRPARRPAPR